MAGSNPIFQSNLSINFGFDDPSSEVPPNSPIRNIQIKSDMASVPRVSDNIPSMKTSYFKKCLNSISSMVVCKSQYDGMKEFLASVEIHNHGNYEELRLKQGCEGKGGDIAYRKFGRFMPGRFGIKTYGDLINRVNENNRNASLGTAPLRRQWDHGHFSAYDVKLSFSPMQKKLKAILAEDLKEAQQFKTISSGFLMIGTGAGLGAIGAGFGALFGALAGFGVLMAASVTATASHHYMVKGLENSIDGLKSPTLLSEDPRSKHQISSTDSASTNEDKITDFDRSQTGLHRNTSSIAATEGRGLTNGLNVNPGISKIENRIKNLGNFAQDINMWISQDKRGKGKASSETLEKYCDALVKQKKGISVFDQALLHYLNTGKDMPLRQEFKRLQDDNEPFYDGVIIAALLYGNNSNSEELEKRFGVSNLFGESDTNNGPKTSGAIMQTVQDSSIGKQAVHRADNDKIGASTLNSQGTFNLSPLVIGNPIVSLPNGYLFLNNAARASGFNLNDPVDEPDEHDSEALSETTFESNGEEDQASNHRRMNRPPPQPASSKIESEAVKYFAWTSLPGITEGSEDESAQSKANSSTASSPIMKPFSFIRPPKPESLYGSSDYNSYRPESFDESVNSFRLSDTKGLSSRFSKASDYELQYEDKNAHTGSFDYSADAAQEQPILNGFAEDEGHVHSDAIALKPLNEIHIAPGTFIPPKVLETLNKKSLDCHYFIKYLKHMAREYNLDTSNEIACAIEHAENTHANDITRLFNLINLMHKNVVQQDNFERELKLLFVSSTLPHNYPAWI